MIKDDKYMTRTEAAEFLGVCTATLFRWEKMKKLIPSKKGLLDWGLYSIKDLERFQRSYVRGQRKGHECNKDNLIKDTEQSIIE